MKRDSQFVINVFSDFVKKKKHLYNKSAKSSAVMFLLQERYHMYFIYTSMMIKMTLYVLFLY